MGSVARSDLTPQEEGYAWERQGAADLGAQLQVGSGNRSYAPLDAAGYELLVSFKYTGAIRSPIDKQAIEEARAAVLGARSASPGRIDIIGYKLGDGTRRADLDWMQFIAWIKEPPTLVPATKQENLRHSARLPSSARDS
jgi:hypothetical protein